MLKTSFASKSPTSWWRLKSARTMKVGPKWQPSRWQVPVLYVVCARSRSVLWLRRGRTSRGWTNEQEAVIADACARFAIAEITRRHPDVPHRRGQVEKFCPCPLH